MNNVVVNVAVVKAGVVISTYIQIHLDRHLYIGSVTETNFYVCPAGLVRQGCECDHQRDVPVTHGSGELGSQRTLEGDSTRMTSPVNEISMPQQVSWNLNAEDLKSPQITVGDF
jgi:hypothetical protein